MVGSRTYSEKLTIADPDPYVLDLPDPYVLDFPDPDPSVRGTDPGLSIIKQT
jgi:hypothetical protein